MLAEDPYKKYARASTEYPEIEFGDTEWADFFVLMSSLMLQNR
jgi:hypothetical protein